MSMPKAWDDFYAAILQAIDDLMALDPASDTPEGRMLDKLSAAVEEFEKVTYPIGNPNENH